MTRASQLARPMAPPRHGSFASLCVALAGDELDLATDFPLRRLVRLRSDVSLAFQSQEFRLEPRRRAAGATVALPTVRLGFLTLAGASGALPTWLSERLLWQRGGRGGASLHAFLDLLNRRFWELYLLAQAAGDNVHYAPLHRGAARAKMRNVFAVAGLRSDAQSDQDALSPVERRRVLQFCAASTRGGGGLEALAHLLSSILRQTIHLHSFQPVRLPVSVHDCVRLGRARTRTTAGLGHVAGLGPGAHVRCGLVVRVINPSSLPAFLPFESAAQWLRLRRVLAIVFGEGLPPQRLELMTPASATHSRLGSSGARLSWGARLGCPRDASSFIGVSARALDSFTRKEDQ